MAENPEREAKQGTLERLKQMAEKAYGEMYEAHSARAADGFYRDAKDCYYDAIALAGELGLAEEAEKLSDRLLHIKAVYRSQFVQ